MIEDDLKFEDFDIPKAKPKRKFKKLADYQEKEPLDQISRKIKKKPFKTIEKKEILKQVTTKHLILGFSIAFLIILLIGMVWFNVNLGELINKDISNSVENNFTIQNENKHTIQNDHTINNNINITVNMPDQMILEIKNATN